MKQVITAPHRIMASCGKHCMHSSIVRISQLKEFMVPQPGGSLTMLLHFNMKPSVDFFAQWRIMNWSSILRDHTQTVTVENSESCIAISESITTPQQRKQRIKNARPLRRTMIRS